jgi:hypothetical protein
VYVLTGKRSARAKKLHASAANVMHAAFLMTGIDTIISEPFEGWRIIAPYLGLVQEFYLRNVSGSPDQRLNRLMY